MHTLHLHQLRGATILMPPFDNDHAGKQREKMLVILILFCFIVCKNYMAIIWHMATCGNGQDAFGCRQLKWNWQTCILSTPNIQISDIHRNVCFFALLLMLTEIIKKKKRTVHKFISLAFYLTIYPTKRGICWHSVRRRAGS
jgi:hypothetical protein